MGYTSYTTNYTILDVVNSDSYHSNESAGTINPDNYAPTSSTVHGIPSGIISMPTGAIMNDGFSQKSLYEILLKIQVNWDNAMSALDDDPGVNTTTYYSGCALGSLAGTYNIHPNGIGTKELATFLQAVATKFAACTDLLDADSTLTDDDYGTTYDIMTTAITGWIPPLTTSTAFDITSPASKIKTTGIDNAALVDFLNTAITNINALWVKLDADI